MASRPVASVSQRVSELRGSSPSVTHAIAVYQGSDQVAAIAHANVSAQVAATTVGTSGDSRLYRYHASSSINGYHARPTIVVIVRRLSGFICWAHTCSSRQIVGEMT